MKKTYTIMKIASRDGITYKAYSHDPSSYPSSPEFKTEAQADAWTYEHALDALNA